MCNLKCVLVICCTAVFLLATSASAKKYISIKSNSRGTINVTGCTDGSGGSGCQQTINYGSVNEVGINYEGNTEIVITQKLAKQLPDGTLEPVTISLKFVVSAANDTDKYVVSRYKEKDEWKLKIEKVDDF